MSHPAASHKAKILRRERGEERLALKRVLSVAEDNDTKRRLHELTGDTFESIIELGQLLSELKIREHEWSRWQLPFTWRHGLKHVSIGTSEFITDFQYRADLPDDGFNRLYEIYQCTPHGRLSNLFNLGIKEGIIKKHAIWTDIQTWRLRMRNQERPKTDATPGAVVDRLENNIHFVDCFVGMQAIPPATVDLILVDLPYGETANRWDTAIDLSEWWNEVKRILCPDGAVVLTSSSAYLKTLINSNEWFTYELVVPKWKKTGFLNSNSRPLIEHDYVLLFAPGKLTYNPQFIPGSYRRIVRPPTMSTNYGRCETPSITEGRDRYPTTLSCPALDAFPSEGRVHPTQKSVAAFSYLIRTYSNEKDMVLDTCAGAGTTAIACLETNRRYILFENNREYYEKAVERIQTWKSAKKN